MKKNLFTTAIISLLFAGCNNTDSENNNVSSEISFATDTVDFEVSKNTDNSILLTFETILILDSISEKIWPGWNASDLTYFMVEVEGCLVLINPHFPIPKDFKKYDKFSDYGHSVYIREKNNSEFEYAGSNFVIFEGKFYSAVETYAYPSHWNADTLFAYLFPLSSGFPDTYRNRIVDLFQSPEMHISVQIHEGFHVFQIPKNKTLKYFLDPTYYSRPKIMAYSYIEGMLLLSALNATNEEEFLKTVHKFISIRQEKNRHLSRKKAGTEIDEEYMEGTAKYVQTMSQILLKELSYSPQIEHLKSLNCSFNNVRDFELFDSLRFISSITQYNSDQFEAKCYFYGQAQCFILDKLCGDIWKTELMNSKLLLWDLIVKYSGYDKKTAPNSKDIKAEFEFERLVKEVKKMDRKKGNGVLSLK
jgi:hypothetical protein